MSFGRNPHVAKAEQEEQKAVDAKDRLAAELAWREAARQWDRAAEREKDAKRRDEYATKANDARAKADGEEPAPALDAIPRDRLN
ncbi:MAG TPA: hypothetical protein VGH87_18525 [Polyangiaceae bacterium]|jgi:hypothetical protein|nr:hypothetical protein [Polyangiaceae bacterium]